MQRFSSSIGSRARIMCYTGATPAFFRTNYAFAVFKPALAKA